MGYKFKIGNTIPPDDKIDKHKDFKKLKANYDKQVAPLYKKPLYKDPKALIVVLIILLLTYLIVEAYQKDGNEEQKIQNNDMIINTPSSPQPTGVIKPSADSIKKDLKQNDTIHIRKTQTDAVKK